MAFAKGGSLYILTNKNKTTLYTGVTSDLASRLREHLLGVYPKSFTARYNLKILVYMEHFSSIEEAIRREKAIKGKTRINKEKLINSNNPNWENLAEEVLSW
ncbi:GIY-YIG nuclease family protein [Roseivirga pacifica]|uniref:GIY-YIG nuclease family protein n=1 Tax=Roseivirga pacifica TaxID=1267423 RepID=UPI00227AA39E|nr:GIY-YIG nuclease family protein [Roseivirga pacifica]